MKNGHLLYGVYLLEAWVLQQAKPSNAEECMKDVYHITRSVCKATQFRILLRLDRVMIVSQDYPPGTAK
jgi:hypothetical protein